MRRLIIAATVAVVTLLGWQVPAHANHLIDFDCAVWNQTRGPFTGTTLRIKWSVSDRYVKIVDMTPRNVGTQTADIRLEYKRDTDEYLYKQETWRLAPNKGVFISGWENVAHSQTFHPKVIVYRNGTYVMTLNFWFSSTRGLMDYVTNLTNCNPTLNP
jgi:hypothetical protein